MATLAAILDRLAIVKGAEAPASATPALWGDANRIREFANEDIFFFAKRIDNTRVVREADPAARRVCWRMITGSLAGSVALVAVMLPTLYGAFAGYKIEALREEKLRLANERAALELQEARFLNPQHLEELANNQKFIDPSPQKIVYLDGKSGATVAKSMTLPAKVQAR